MVIQHNLLAMNANRMFSINNKKQAKKTEKLSSGYRINRAADDAAGLAISEKMRRQVRGLTQASANCQDGVSLVQIADGALAEVQDMLDRCSELSIKAANGTITDKDRTYIQAEISQIKLEIDQIKEKAQFNEIKVLNGALNDAGPGVPTVLGGLPSWVTADGGTMSAGQLNKSVSTAEGNRRGTEIDFGALTADNVKELAAANSGIYTTCCTCSTHYSINFVEGTAAPTKTSGDHIIYEVSIDGVTSGDQLVDKILAKVGNNPNHHYTKLEKDGSTLKIFDERPEYDPVSGSYSPGTGYGQIGPGVAYDAQDVPVEPDIIIWAGTESDKNLAIEIKLPSISSSALKITGANVTTQASAKNAIDSFKKAKEFVSEERSRMGAYQNRLEHTINNLNNVVENTAAAESAIRDSDMALEMVDYSVNNILLQAGQAMIAQANQSKQGIMSLLQ